MGVFNLLFLDIVVKLFDLLVTFSSYDSFTYISIVWRGELVVVDFTLAETHGCCNDVVNWLEGGTCYF